MTVSVVMPAYNAERTLEESVNSVLSQTFGDFELIIIDDCSTDGTALLCAGFAESDPRIRVFRNEANKGVAESRNRGIAEARGVWIAFLDSDDIWFPDKLKKHLAFIQETGADVSYTSYTVVDKDGRASGYVLHAERELTCDKLLKRNLMSSSSVIVKRDLISRYKFPSGPLHEDYALWIQLVHDAGIAYGLDEPLKAYRVSKTSRSAPRIRSGIRSYRTYRHVGYGRLRSLLLTLRYAVYSIKRRKEIGIKAIAEKKRTA